MVYARSLRNAFGIFVFKYAHSHIIINLCVCIHASQPFVIYTFSFERKICRKGRFIADFFTKWVILNFGCVTVLNIISYARIAL